MKLETEKMSDEFEKFHLKEIPFSAAIHHFTGIDTDHPHDHPFSFVSHILRGGYVEKVFTVSENGEWSSELIHRAPGTVHRIEAVHIHQIVELPEGECWTAIVPEEKVRETRFWQFDENGSKSRLWYEPEFK